MDKVNRGLIKYLLVEKMVKDNCDFEFEHQNNFIVADGLSVGKKV